MISHTSLFSSGASFVLLMVVGAGGRVTAQCPTQWIGGPGVPGTNGPIYATTMWDADGAGPMQPVLVVGGSFTVAGTVAVDGIAAYDPVAGVWSALGLVGGPVMALTSTPTGELVAGGWIGGHVLRWTGAAWTPLGGGTNSAVTALATMPNGDVIAGGLFSMAGVVAASRIARWDGASWSSLGSGLSGVLGGNSAYALAVLPNGDLLVGGDFTAAGGVSVDSIARWDGVALTWTAIGGGTSPFALATVTSLIAMQNGNLAAGGWLPVGALGSSGVFGIWNGLSWSVASTTGLGISSGVSALAELPNGDLIVAGEFASAQGTPASNIARWNGTNWSALGSGTYMSVNALTTLPNGDLVAAGWFNSAGGVAVGHVAYLASTCPATVASVGVGCTGSAGLNVLTATTLPWTGSTFRSVATGMPANALVLGVLGLSTVSTPLAPILPSPAGCTLLVSPDLLALYLPTAGSVQTQIVIPDTVALAGQVVRQQVAPIELDLLGNITAVSITNALTLTIGSF